MKKEQKEQIMKEILFISISDLVKNIDSTKSVAGKPVKKIIYDYSNASLSIKFLDGESIRIKSQSTPITAVV